MCPCEAEHQCLRAVRALRAGLLEGLRGVAAAVLLTDGTFHEVDSCERGYEIAGREAGRAALIGAGLLPPDQAQHPALGLLAGPAASPGGDALRPCVPARGEAAGDES